MVAEKLVGSSSASAAAATSLPSRYNVHTHPRPSFHVRTPSRSHTPRPGSMSAFVSASSIIPPATQLHPPINQPFYSILTTFVIQHSQPPLSSSGLASSTPSWFLPQRLYQGNTPSVGGDFIEQDTGCQRYVYLCGFDSP